MMLSGPFDNSGNIAAFEANFELRPHLLLQDCDLLPGCREQKVPEL
jgi:hypothetical protein